MASWTEFSAAAPELAERVKQSFDAHKHKTMATLRKDGSPRISGTEVEFSDGELWLGSMPNALKAKDLLRDPRFAIHNGYSDTTPRGHGGREARRAGGGGPAPRATTASGSTSARHRWCASTRSRRT